MMHLHCYASAVFYAAVSSPMFNINCPTHYADFCRSQFPSEEIVANWNHSHCSRCKDVAECVIRAVVTSLTATITMMQWRTAYKSTPTALKRRQMQPKNVAIQHCPTACIAHPTMQPCAHSQHTYVCGTHTVLCVSYQVERRRCSDVALESPHW